ncbi:hypothetical protein R2D02_002827 [Salmonella enterica]|nr:hypothetical protein [Salmonella enterica]
MRAFIHDATGDIEVASCLDYEDECMWTFLVGISAFLMLLVWLFTIVGLVKPGAIKAKNRFHVLSAFFVYNIVLFIIGGFAASKIDKNNNAPAPSVAEKSTDIPNKKDETKVDKNKIKRNEIAEKCDLSDSKCLYNEYLPRASYPCKKKIERLARYDFEWEDSFLGVAFTRITNDARNNEIIFIGDQLKFTNGFGAKMNMMYSCTYNIKTNSVVNVNVAEGRLPE